MSPSELDILRSRGVKSYAKTEHGYSVEFFAPEPTADKPKKDAPTDMCRCGHHKDDDHMNGVCIRLCDPNVCAGPEK